MANSIHDVADFIYRRGIRDRWSVQKLLYYCQAWSLAWDGEPLFPEGFEAWRDGPVCRAIWDNPNTVGGNYARLTQEQRATVEAVLGFYGQKESWWLVDLSHREAPWIDARGDVAPSAYTSTPISNEAMLNFYRAYGVSAKQFTPEFRETMELLAAMPEEVLRSEEPEKFVDAEPFLNWLDTGEGDPWEKSSN